MTSISNSNQLTKIPTHVAIIMDGNGRWAKNKGEERIFGHQHGVEAVRSTIEGAAEIGIKFLTLYTFSTENWNRPVEEINALMDLLVQSIHNELPSLMKNKIRLQAIGNLESLPTSCYNNLLSAISQTSQNSGLTVVLALSYSGRWEITESIKKIAQDFKNNKFTLENISPDLINNYLNTHSIPDPDILIRTGGEHRISNFLLWQLAYTEMFFPKIFWPDFRKEDLFAIINDFQSIERRYGKISEQLK